MNVKLEYPFASEKIVPLRVGQRVTISGLVFTGRDRVHRYLAEGGKSPVDLRDGGIYHCGPVVVRKAGQWVVRAAGPTTSIREEPYMASIIERHRVRLILGKGGMGESTRKACVRNGCVYLQAVGGAGALLAAKVTGVVGVHFLREFGEAEAVWVLRVQDLEAVVTMDAHGGSLHRQVLTRSGRCLSRLIHTASGG